MDLLLIPLLLAGAVFLYALVSTLRLRTEALPPPEKPSAPVAAPVEATPEPPPAAEPAPEPEAAPAPAPAPEAAPAPAPAPEAAPAPAPAPEAAPAPEPVPEAAPAPAPAPVAAPAPAAPPSAEALKEGLKSTRGGFIAKLSRLFGAKKKLDPALFDEAEEILLTADLGVHTTMRILDSLRARNDKGELDDPARIWDALKEDARAILAVPGADRPLELDGKPSVILVVGVNGVGKTTTIGKLASRFQSEGKKVMLAAGDTFRAAATTQLEIWGERVGCEVVKGKEGADPSSVIFDAVKRAQAEAVDVLICDTAGRLHTKTPLMEELAKVSRTIEKALGRPADERLLVLDATTGQNAIQQANTFKEAVSLSGIVLTKLDGTAKGGVILGIVDQHKVPVRFIGIGEKVADLQPFDASAFVEALFTREDLG
ncbi:MAG: signal recognition particle-docking protein FtsY [Myxococcales bacterium]|nr:signal recognition particle-docking protein FtsY [Myxococcales bacterium]